MNFDVVVTIIVAGVSGGLLQYAIGIFIDRRKRAVDVQQTEANIYNQSAEMALKLAEGLAKRVDELEGDLSEQVKQLNDERKEREKLQKKVDNLSRGVRALVKQIRDLGQEPVFSLDEE